MERIQKPTRRQLDERIGTSRPITAEKWKHAYEVSDLTKTLQEGYAVQGGYEHGLIDLWQGPMTYLGMVHQWGTSTELVSSDDLGELVRWFTATRERLE